MCCYNGFTVIVGSEMYKILKKPGHSQDIEQIKRALSEGGVKKSYKRRVYLKKVMDT